MSTDPEIDPEFKLEPEPDLDAPERHPGPGRPRRADWRPAAALLIEPPGAALLIDGTWTPFRVRARLLGTKSEELAVLEVDGATQEIPLGRIRRYRVVDSLWMPGDLVLRRGESAAAWRGVVLRIENGLVEVETINGIEGVDADDLESAWARDESPVRPAFKPGPVASDPVVEEVNTADFRARTS